MVGDTIILQDICKRFRSKVIFDHINLTIRKGESVAFIGHNGAGKSTLLKIISGIIKADSGNRILVPELPLFHYIPEHFPKLNMTAREYIRHMSNIDGIQSEEQEERALGLFQDFFMEGMIDIPMKHLSKGTLQKVGVVQALLTQPDILLLDEPLSGQDMDSQQVFIQKMNELRENQTTLIMSCHEKYLIDRISDTVYKIQDGSLERVQVIPEDTDIIQYICEFDGKESTHCIPIEWKERDDITINRRHREEEDLVTLAFTGQAKDCNRVIQAMMEQGWILKGMKRNETDRKDH